MLVLSLITCQCKGWKWDLCTFLSKLLLLLVWQGTFWATLLVSGQERQTYVLKEKDQVRFFSEQKIVGLQCLVSPHQIREFDRSSCMRRDLQIRAMQMVLISGRNSRVGLEWSRDGQQKAEGKSWGNGTLCLSFPLEFSDEDGREAGERLRRKEGMKTPKKKKKKQNLSLVNAQEITARL